MSTGKQYQPILIIKVVNYLTWKIAAIQRFQAERFVFTVKTSGHKYKVFQVVFGKSDGSLYITLPYFDIQNGIVSTGAVPPLSLSKAVDLTEVGKVTSSHLKYAHHPDGVVHFSQTGKVKSLVSKQSLPLARADGHLFSLHVQGLSHYEQDSNPVDSPPKLNRTVLNFAFDNKEPKAIKFSAWWYQAKTLIRMNQGGFYGPKGHSETPNGNIKATFMIGPPQGWPMEKHVLLVRCEETELIDKSEGPLMFFIGGFDGLTRVSDISKPATFLCASYPAYDYAELAKRIGTIDLQQSQEQPNTGST